MSIMPSVVEPRHLSPPDLPFSAAADATQGPSWRCCGLGCYQTPSCSKWPAAPGSMLSTLPLHSLAGNGSPLKLGPRHYRPWRPAARASRMCACHCGWMCRPRPRPLSPAAFDAVFVANLLHIAPWEATPSLLNGPAICLGHDGVLAVYGPFIVDDEPLRPSNAAFDADVGMRDAHWGLRSLQQIQNPSRDAGLVLAERYAMPANNLMLRSSVAS